MTEHCCERMDQAVHYRCPNHPNPFECPDNLVCYSEEREEYGLIVHDGSESYVVIEFCPWCGKHLPRG